MPLTRALVRHKGNDPRGQPGVVIDGTMVINGGAYQTDGLGALCVPSPDMGET